MVIDDIWGWRRWSLLRGKLEPMVGDQELDIEGGVNADPLPCLWKVQGVGRGSIFLQNLEGTVLKVFQLLHLPGGAQVFHVE